jgi:hypothetical protein
MDVNVHRRVEEVLLISRRPFQARTLQPEKAFAR